MCQVDGPNTKSCLNSHFAQQILHPCESHQTLGNVPENASWWQDANCSEYQCIVETCKMPDYLQICCKPETESKNLRLHSMIHHDSYSTWLHVSWHSPSFHRDSNGCGGFTGFSPHLSDLSHSIQLVSWVHRDQSCTSQKGLRRRASFPKMEWHWNDNSIIIYHLVT